MKMLQLVSYYEPERVANSHLAKDRESAFAAAGFHTELYAPMPTRGVSAEERARYKEIKQEERHNGQLVIHRFSMFREGHNPLQRAIRYLLVNASHYFKASRVENADVIFCGSTPPTQGAMCGLIKKRLSRRYKRSVPFIFVLQDIFPDSLVNAKMTKKGSLIWKIGRRIEDFTYRSADRIIVISEGFKQNIMAKGVPEEKIVVVPNWVDTDQVRPIAREDNILFDRYGLDRSKFIVCYSGNIGHSQNLGLLLEAARRLKDELPDMHFVLIGEGAAKAELEKKVAEENLANVTILPFQPYEEIAHVFSLGDAGLIMSKPGVGGSSVPSKTWSIMAAERPVLTSFDMDSELFRMVDSVGCGVCADPSSVDALVEGVKTLYNNREAAAEMGKKGRAYVREYLDKERCTGMYVQTVLEVTE